MNDKAYRRAKDDNCKAYGTLLDLEVLLRELIADLLQKRYGPRWPKALPPDVREKVKKAIEYERATPWTRTTPRHPLYYVDFPDLKKIIINGQIWKDVFESVFPNKSIRMCHCPMLNSFVIKLLTTDSSVLQIFRF